MKRWLCGLLACLMLLGTALADDVCYIANVAGEQGVSTGCSYLTMKVPVEEEALVTLTITGENGKTVYSRDFGLCAGSFRTEDIYLGLKGSRSVYNVTLQVGDKIYVFPVERVASRISGSAACTAGYPLSEMTGAKNWRMAMLLPVTDGTVTVPVYAAGAYEVGSAFLTVADGTLTVSVTMDGAADGSVDSAKIYVAANADEAAQLGKNKFSGATGKLDKAIPLGDAEIIAVYVKMEVTFDPSGAAAVSVEPLADQEALWLQMMEPNG